MLSFVRQGDCKHVQSIDRFARSLADLSTMVTGLVDRGVAVKFVQENLDFSGAEDAMATFTLHIMGAFAQFERSMIRSRQMHGIAKRKAAGLYKGRSKNIRLRADIKNLRAQGLSYSQIRAKLGCSTATISKVLKDSTNETP